MTRPQHEFELVKKLLDEGHNDCEIARLVSVPRTTVRDWRKGRGATATRWPSSGVGTCRLDHHLDSVPPRPYSYLLGMYLGDGYIATHAREVYCLRIFTDARYEDIIEECRMAMNAIFPAKRANVQPRSDSQCVEVVMYSKHWPCLFPQHGPGRKHERPIYLAEWQQQIVESATESFVRGLIHSDGCRVIANDRGVASVRYHFSNRSEDIKGLFCAALDRLEIPWTRPSSKDIAIYRKVAVARLDEFIGPKS